MSNVVETAAKYGEELGGTKAQATAQETTNEPIRVVTEPIPFPSTNKSQLVTTTDVGGIINAHFKPIFNDYEGCNIVYKTIDLAVPNATGMNGFAAPNHSVAGIKIGRYEVDLFFRITSGSVAEGKIKNVIDLTKNGVDPKTGLANGVKASRGFSYAGVMAIQNRANPSKNLTLTQDTKDILDRFFIQAPYRKMVNVTLTTSDGKKSIIKKSVPRYDEALIYEINDNPVFNPSMHSVYLKVTCLDLIELLREIYGTKSENGHTVDYDVVSVRPLTNIELAGAANVNALLNITQLDCTEVERIYNKLGLNAQISAVSIIR